MDEAADASARAPRLTWLWGARIQRVDAPEPHLFVLTLYQRPQKHHLLLALDPARCGVGVSSERPQGLPASAFVRRLRVQLENARLAEIHALGTATATLTGALELSCVRHETRTRLVADFGPRQPNLLWLDESGRIVAAADEVARRERFSANYAFNTKPCVAVPRSEEEASASAAALLAGRAQQAEDAQRKRARAQLKAALKRAERKRTAIQADLERAADAPALRRQAELLLCHLAEVPRGASVVELENDLGPEPPEPLRIHLDPALSAQQNAEAKFSRARRMARGVGIASERLRAIERELAELTSALAALETAPIEAISEQTAALGIPLPMQPAPTRRARAQPVHMPYRLFEGSASARILVGKNAADNDALTLHVARPEDLWLHARNIHGSHVVLQRPRGKALPPEALLDAAHLAAHFSAARGERLVEIQHTERRYVRKPKGAAAGSVRLERERTLLLRVEPERLQRLLANEREPTQSR